MDLKRTLECTSLDLKETPREVRKRLSESLGGPVTRTHLKRRRIAVNIFCLRMTQAGSTSDVQTSRFLVSDFTPMMKKFSAVSGTDHLRYVLVSKKRNEEWKKRTSKSYRERRVQNANQIGARQQGKNSWYGS